MNEALFAQWQRLPLSRRMGNIGSEISRARHWEDLDPVQRDRSLERVLELLDMTIADERLHHHGLREIVRLREAVCDGFVHGKDADVPLEQLEKYCTAFAFYQG